MIITGIKAGETDDAVQFYDTSSLPPTLRTIPKKDIVGIEAHGNAVGDAERLRVETDAAAAAGHRLVPEDRPSGGPRVSVTLNEVVR